jgi:uncharacterized phage protein gp47/JayE
MAVALSDLLIEPTEESVLAFALENLDALGFGATSWQPGSWGLTFTRYLSRMVADVGKVIPVTARSGFIRLATGDWATVVAREVYDVIREAATTTAGEFVLTSTPGAPSHVIAAGDLQFATAPSGDAITYRNTTGGTLNPGSTLTLDVVAEVAGSAGNIPADTTLYMWTPLVGVTVTNPPIPPSTTWVTVIGIDEESDERLRERAIGQWSTLGYGVGESGYTVWALEADPTVTRVLAKLGPSDGDVIVVCATDVGGITSQQEQDISDYIHGITDGVGRRPINDVVTVRSATVDSGPFIMTVTVASAAQAVTTALVCETAIVDYLARLPIGGLVIPPAAPPGLLIHAEMVAALMALEGVLNVSITSPSGDYTFATDESVGGPIFTTTMVYV